tara:strand:+ start:28294 stop:29148 length:855 start_codon:yes stop_codon:yes gene_type:complete
MANQKGQRGAELGPIRTKTDITVDVATRPALRVWAGRDKTADKKGILGVPGFASITRTLEENVKLDDPYADFHYILIEEAIAKLRSELDQELEAVTSFLNEMVPPAMTLPDIGSNEPCVLPIRFASRHGFAMLYELLKMDKVVMKTLLANHIGLLNSEEKFKTLNRLEAKMRTALYTAYAYRVTGVTRDDMAANNQKAQRAIGMMGELKTEFLEGTTRSPNAPQLPKSRLATLVSPAKLNVDNEPSAEADQNGESSEYSKLSSELQEVVASSKKAPAKKKPQTA